MEKIIIFGKDSCPFTQNARRIYGNKAEYFDVLKNEAKMQEMLKYSKGERKVPVIVDGDNIQIGYGGS